MTLIHVNNVNSKPWILVLELQKARVCFLLKVSLIFAVGGS